MTDKTDSKEHEAFEAWRSDLPYQGATQLQKEAFIAGFRAAIEQGGSGAAIAEIGSAAGEDAEFGQRAIYPLVDIDGFEYGTKLYARASLAVSAGSGSLMGQPQEMPDLTTLTERGAKAWAGVDAQGLREGVANAGSEPVAWVDEFELANIGHNDFEPTVSKEPVSEHDVPLYTHPSPPEGMVGGWMPIETAPRDGSEVLANTTGLGRIVVYWDDDESQWGTGLGYLHRDAPTHWMPLPPPPTTSAGSGKGE